ncbi:MAG: ankyrin repeat domain-containing protein [Cellvibrio sp.]|nr:ankyrin repeat domain-containing protein [Cellvibrio sp.]
MGDVDGVRELLAQGADVNHTTERGAVLHQVVTTKNLEMIRVLIDAGADVNKLDSYGRTPLGKVVFHPSISEKKRIQITKVLLDSGASPNIWRRYNGSSEDESPLIDAVQRKNFELVELLLSHGANVNDLSSKKQLHWILRQTTK